jgi:transposase
MLYYFMQNSELKFDKNYRDQEQIISLLTARNVSSESIIESQKREISSLKEQIDWLKRQVFGQKSERITDMPSDTPELPGFVLPDAVTKVETAKENISYERKKGIKKNKGNCTLSLPADLPIEEKVIELPEEKRFHPKTGEALVEISRETVDKLAYTPETYKIKRSIYVKYAVKGKSLSGIFQQPAEDCIISGSKFDASFMAHVVTEKFGYHLPFYRQQEKLNFMNIGIERQTLSSLVLNLGLKAAPICDEMKKQMFGYGYLFTDDTTVQMLQPGSGKTKQCRIWVYANAKPNAPPYTIFVFTEGRSSKYPKSFLRNFEGVIHADAYESYVSIDKSANFPIRWSACWCHARRYFEESKAGDRELRDTVLKYMRYLFMFERTAWKRNESERLEIRQQKEKPIVDAIYELMRKKIAEGKMLPEDKITKAVGYLQKHETNFRMYLDDPNLRMENNSAERPLRKVELGRKNWLFVGSKRAGEAAGNLISLVQTCRTLNINPQEYLEDIFRRLPAHPHKNISELLPDQWKKLKSKA